MKIVNLKFDRNGPFNNGVYDHGFCQPPHIMEIKFNIDQSNLPKHVAIIMDGNGRWAKTHGMPRIFGHRNGVKAVRETTEIAAELGIEYLTLYAFSTENWKRPRLEVDALMRLLVDTIRNEIDTLNENNIRLKAIGDVSKLPKSTYQALQEGLANTKHNDRMTLILALNYSGKWEIMQAVNNLAKKVANGELNPGEISEQAFEHELATNGIPDPELLIRTSGEQRLSNFLIWQMAYAELYFTPVFWPEFRKQHFCEAILDYQNRERRFGKISEQLVS